MKNSLSRVVYVQLIPFLKKFDVLKLEKHIKSSIISNVWRGQKKKKI